MRELTERAHAKGLKLKLTDEGVTVDGERDVLGLWAGKHGDGKGNASGTGGDSAGGDGGPATAERCTASELD